MEALSIRMEECRAERSTIERGAEHSFSHLRITAARVQLLLFSNLGECSTVPRKESSSLRAERSCPLRELNSSKYCKDYTIVRTVKRTSEIPQLGTYYYYHPSASNHPLIDRVVVARRSLTIEDLSAGTSVS
eukprot:203922-Amphidinium_carterae.1